jgi:hypothetical protein
MGPQASARCMRSFLLTAAADALRVMRARVEHHARIAFGDCTKHGREQAGVVFEHCRRARKRPFRPATNSRPRRTSRTVM